VSLSVEREMTSVRLVVPTDVTRIVELTDEIRLGMRSVIQQLRNVGLALGVKDKHELVNQFMLQGGETPILVSVEKVILDGKDQGRKILTSSIPNHTPISYPYLVVSVE